MRITYVYAYIPAYIRVHGKSALYIRQNPGVHDWRIRLPCCKREVIFFLISAVCEHASASCWL